MAIHEDGKIIASKSGSFLSLPSFLNEDGTDNVGVYPNIGLNITIYNDVSRSLVVAEEFSVVGRSIRSNNDNGIDVPLPVASNNALVLKNNICNSIFFIDFKVFNTQTKEQLGKDISYKCGVEGDLTELVDHKQTVNTVSYDASKVTQESVATASVAPQVAAEIASTQTATTAQPSVAKKSLLPLILGIIGGLIALALIVFAILYFTGIFPKSDENANNEPVQSQEQTQQEEPKEEPTQEPIQQAAQEQAQEPTQEPAQTATQPTASANENVCSISDKNDAQILSACIATRPGNEVIVKLAKEAVEKNRCDLAKRIYSSLGRKDAAIAVEVAKYYDANTQVSSSCFEKSKDQATYWYQKAVDLGDESAKSALEKLQ